MSQIPAQSSRSIRRCPTLSRRVCPVKLDRRLPFDNRRPLDDQAQQFAGWWHRMHRKRSGMICIRTKSVIYPDGKTGRPARYFWEVCKWPRFGGFDWVFVCWMIDGVGMWSKKFPTKKAALSFFGSSPDVVMNPPEDDPSRRGVVATAAAPSP